jgi:hypothetical protein
VDREKLQHQLDDGITTTYGRHKGQLLSCHNWTDPIKIQSFINQFRLSLPHEYNTTEYIRRGYEELFNATALSTIVLVVKEGKHRMVRRMMANVGHPVVTLHRNRLGNITLDPTRTPPGTTRLLSDAEREWVHSLLPKRTKEIIYKQIREKKLQQNQQQ